LEQRLKLRDDDLAKARAEIEQLRARNTKFRIKAHARSVLAQHGITDPKRQSLLLPGLMTQVSDASVDPDTGDVLGDFEAAAKEVAAMFTQPKAEEEAKPAEPQRNPTMYTRPQPAAARVVGTPEPRKDIYGDLSADLRKLHFGE
jgi:hypothetical protein